MITTKKQGKKGAEVKGTEYIAPPAMPIYKNQICYVDLDNRDATVSANPPITGLMMLQTVHDAVWCKIDDEKCFFAFAPTSYSYIVTLALPFNDDMSTVSTLPFLSDNLEGNGFDTETSDTDVMNFSVCKLDNKLNKDMAVLKVGSRLEFIEITKDIDIWAATPLFGTTSKVANASYSDLISATSKIYNNITGDGIFIEAAIKTTSKIISISRFDVNLSTKTATTGFTKDITLSGFLTPQFVKLIPVQFTETTSESYLLLVGGKNDDTTNPRSIVQVFQIDNTVTDGVLNTTISDPQRPTITLSDYYDLSLTCNYENGNISIIGIKNGVKAMELYILKVSFGNQVYIYQYEDSFYGVTSGMYYNVGQCITAYNSGLLALYMTQSPMESGGVVLTSFTGNGTSTHRPGMISKFDFSGASTTTSMHPFIRKNAAYFMFLNSAKELYFIVKYFNTMITPLPTLNTAIGIADKDYALGDATAKIVYPMP